VKIILYLFVEVLIYAVFYMCILNSFFVLFKASASPTLVSFPGAIDLLGGLNRFNLLPVKKSNLFVEVLIYGAFMLFNWLFCVL
jgi:hypothetical protein